MVNGTCVTWQLVEAHAYEIILPKSSVRNGPKGVDGDAQMLIFQALFRMLKLICLLVVSAFRVIIRAVDEKHVLLRNKLDFETKCQ